MAIHLVQYNPELPQNTGNMMRTCAATGIKLHLIKPMGFNLDEKSLKRSGANLVDRADCAIYDNWQEFAEKNKEGKFYFCTAHSQRNHTEIDFSDVQLEHFIILGPENNDIPEAVFQPYDENCFRLPVVNQAYSLNISNIGAVVVYEALRQQDFLDLCKVELLKEMDWLLRNK